MKLLAIDPGTCCGWCVTDGTVYDSGVWNLAGGRFEGGGMRYLRFRTRLEEVLPLVTVVAYEEVRRHMGVDAAHVYGGLQAVLTEECERRKISYFSVPVGTVKKHATGKGNANKDAVVAAAESWLGRQVKDHNEADALWIARYSIEKVLS